MPIPVALGSVGGALQSAALGSFSDDVRAGLTATPKSLPPKYFYDALGSALFEAICHLPEYYVTRGEAGILTRFREEVAAAAGRITHLVELGPGSGRKTRILLDALIRPSIEYIPIDVDDSMLRRLSQDLAAEYPDLTVRPSQADFLHPAKALEGVLDGSSRTLVLFLGSTIGNLDRDEAISLFRELRGALRKGDSVLLGADLKKEKAILDAAYNDALGITAAFNLNLLQRINRELGGHFDLGSFAHRAFYDEQRGRIEMHLVSRRSQTVRIDALDIDVRFSEGETIHTENSWKYDEESVGAIATAAGFRIEQRWTDSKAWFADVLLRAE